MTVLERAVAIPEAAPCPAPDAYAQAPWRKGDLATIEQWLGGK